MKRVSVLDWGPEPLVALNASTQSHLATFLVESYTGHHLDGSRLTVVGRSEPVWVSPYHSVFVQDEPQEAK